MSCHAGYVWIFWIFLLLDNYRAEKTTKVDLNLSTAGEKDKNITVLIGTTLILHCNDDVDKNIPFLTWRFDKGFAKKENTIATCSLTSRECIRQTNMENIQVSYEELKISSIKREDSGMYSCEKFTRAGKTITLSANIIAGTPPGKPKIEIDDTSILENRDHLDFIEGDEVLLKCESFGGYPKPTFRWANEQFENIPADEISHFNELYGKSVSKLRLKLRAEDNYSKLKCFVINEMTQQESDATFNINVRYKPRIELSHKTNNWIIVANELTLIECKANAYPNANVKWLNEENQVASNGSVLFLGKDPDSIDLLERAKDSLKNGQVYDDVENPLKKYTCLASSSEGETKMEIRVRISYPPIIQMPNKLQINEGSSLETLQCNVRAEPRPSFVSWSRVDQINHARWNSTLLRLENVSVETAGRYRCEAENHIQPTGRKYQVFKTQEEVEVIVFYKPRAPQIKLSKSEVTVGDRTEMTCHPHDSQPGLPLPKFRMYRSRPGLILDEQFVKNFLDGHANLDNWEQIKEFNQKRNSLILDSPSLTDEGIYFCEAENKIGKMISVPFNFEVYSPLKWIKQPTDLDLDLVTVSSKEVTIDCIVQGDTMPRILWTRNEEILIEFNFEREFSRKLYQNKDIHISIQNNLVINEMEIKLITVTNDGAGNLDRKNLIWQLRSTLKWPERGIEPGSEGKYSCLAQNEIREKDFLRHDFTINLKYPILIYPGHEDVQTFNLAKNSIVLKYLFLSPTQPKDIEFKQDNTILSLSHSQISVERVLRYGTQVWSVEIVLSRVYSQMKSSRYSCRAKNAYGEAIGYVRLVEIDRPSRIENLEVRHVSWDCVDLSWKKNHNGGSQQTFIIEYKAKDDSVSGYHKFNFTENQIKYIANQNVIKYEFCGLLSDEKYTLRMASVNDLGKAPFSNSVEFHTKKPDLPIHIIYQYIRGNKELKVYPPQQKSKHCILIEYSTNDGYNWDKLQRICSSDVERMLQQKPNYLHKSSQEIYQEKLTRLNYPKSGNSIEQDMQQDDLATETPFQSMTGSSKAHYVIIKHPSDEINSSSRGDNFDLGRLGQSHSQFYRLRNCLISQPHICNRPYIINLDEQKPSDLTTTMMAIIVLVSVFALLILLVLSLMITFKVKHKKKLNNNIRMKNLSLNLSNCMAGDYPSLLNNFESSLANTSAHIQPSPTSSSKFGNSLRAASTVNTLTSNTTGKHTGNDQQTYYTTSQNGNPYWTSEQIKQASYQNIHQQKYGSDSTMSLLPLGPPNQQGYDAEGKNLWKIQDHIYLEQQDQPHPHQTNTHINVYTPGHQAKLYAPTDHSIYTQSPSISGDSGKENKRIADQAFYSTSLQRMQTLNAQNLQVYFPLPTTNQEIQDLEPAFITTVQLSNDVPVELITVDNHQVDPNNIYFRSNINNNQNDAERYVIPKSFCRL